MSQENLEIVRRAIEAAARRPPDWPTMNALFDPRHELVELTDFVDVDGTRIGADGYRGWRDMVDQTGDWRVEIADARATPDGRVAVLVRFLLKGGRSGAHVEQKMCLFCSVSNGKIMRTESYAGWRDPLRAAGLEE